MKKIFGIILTIISIAMGFDNVSAQENNGESIQSIKIDDSTSITFKARVIESKARSLVTSGAVIFEEKVYYGVNSPPLMILSSGVVEKDGKPVNLDVSSLADAWATDDKIPSRYVKVTKIGEDNDNAFSVSVCFVKGGATDYMVEWIVKDGKSFRKRIEDLGDILPDWVKDR